MITENSYYTVLAPLEFNIADCSDTNRVGAFTSISEHIQAIVVRRDTPKVPVALILSDTEAEIDYDSDVDTPLELCIYGYHHDRYTPDDLEFDTVRTCRGGMAIAVRVLLYSLDMFDGRIVLERRIAAARRSLAEREADVRAAQADLALLEAERERDRDILLGTL